MKFLKLATISVLIVFFVSVGLSYLMQTEGLFKKYEHELAVCAIFRNEAPYLKEWIDYHHDILGATKFYLYDNESTDEYLSVLRPYIENGLVELIEWDSTEEHAIYVAKVCTFPWAPYQIAAYTDCCKNRALNKVRWLAVMDIDEFIVPTKNLQSFHKLLKSASKPNLKKFLKNPFKMRRPAGCIKLHWLMFGTSKIWDIEKGERLTDKLTYRVEEDYITQINTKCLYRPEAVET
ncbi:glycosyltransferase family 92 protein [Simkania sp.]|uniref:glycosyltransferase family 92 protein n=1 Tax=Simkania sp. TaxID=34094 RepID=UPI003B5160E0